MKCIAIIPARIGSKSIKKKNLLKINGVSFIEKTILSLKKNKFLNCIAVSTDSTEIQKIAKKNKVWCEKLRPKKISGSKAKTKDAINFVIKNINEKFDYIFEIHPTYYFRRSEDLDKCYRIIKKKKYKNIISISKITTCAHKYFQTKIYKGNLMFNKLPGDFNKFYISNSYEFNGYIQGSEYKHFIKYGSHFNNTKKSGYLIIDNKKTLIDLNDLQDLEIIKKIAN